jgi:hypothetical protein
MSLGEITALRRALWFDCGYRPVPLLTADDPDYSKAGKAPVHKNWPGLARRTPPWAAVVPAQQRFANTGVLADGLRLIDVDLELPAVADAVEALAFRHLGPAPTRRRRNSARFAMLYAAATGCPGKRTLAGTRGSIEALGHGQQFVAYGRHVSGAAITWNVEPLDLPAWQLPGIDEAQITAFFSACAPVIGAELRSHRAVSLRGAAVSCTGLARLASALDAIPADDYSTWQRVGCALHHATGGSNDGLALWDAWSATGTKYRAAEIPKRWASFGTGSTINRVGPGTIIRLARMHGWHPPQCEPDPDWLAAHPPIGATTAAPALARLP